MHGDKILTHIRSFIYDFLNKFDKMFSFSYRYQMCTANNFYVSVGIIYYIIFCLCPTGAYKSELSAGRPWEDDGSRARCCALHASVPARVAVSVPVAVQAIIVRPHCTVE